MSGDFLILVSLVSLKSTFLKLMNHDGVTPHFLKTKKIAAKNFVEAGSATMNDKDSGS